MKILRLVLVSAFVGSSLIQATLAEVAWGLNEKAAGAMTVVLIQLSLLAAAAALWQFLIAVGQIEIDSDEKKDREVLLLTPVFFLQIVPLAIVFDLASAPFAAASLALLIGLVPVTASVARERLRT